MELAQRVRTNLRNAELPPSVLLASLALPEAVVVPLSLDPCGDELEQGQRNERRDDEDPNDDPLGQRECCQCHDRQSTPTRLDLCPRAQLKPADPVDGWPKLVVQSDADRCAWFLRPRAGWKRFPTRGYLTFGE
jgi:hypothetical protein